jgi:hypothetical protein
MTETSGKKTGTAIKMNDELLDHLKADQERGLQRGVTLLSKLTFSKEQMAIDALKSSVSIGMASHSFATGGGDDDTVGSIIGDAAESKISALLGKCWDKAREKVEKHKWLKRACHLLEVGMNQLLSWVKGLILNGKVLAQVVPFYGNIKGIIDGAILAVNAHGQRTSFEALSSMGDTVASGISSAALDAFTKYARAETLRTAGKSAYTFAKSIGGLLAEIFSFGAWKVVDFVIAVVEAITSFVFSLVQAILFDKATEKFGEHARANTLPTPEDFRTIVSGCSFVGCVFFAAANYIGHFQISALMSAPGRVLSSKMLTDSLTKISAAQRTACEYTSNAHFKVSFRTTQGKEEFGWILKMIEGFADDAPKSYILTDKATRWQRFKHKTKKLMHKVG